VEKKRTKRKRMEKENTRESNAGMRTKKKKLKKYHSLDIISINIDVTTQ